MKLYFHPVSGTSLPIVLFCAESGVRYEPAVVDLMVGAHKAEPFLQLNPRGLVPVLDDEGFVLTESSAILKYIAEKIGSPAYPKDLRARALVNARMDWINTELFREVGFHLAFPQVFPHHARPDAGAQASILSWGKDQARSALSVFDAHGIGRQRYLCGDTITIADYFASGVIAYGSLVAGGYATFPNVRRWLETMKSLPSWSSVFGTFDGFAGSLAGKAFVTLDG